MDINKRNRTELKSYFVKNAIPTESNFADLIEGALNQKDDGIVKLPGNPLSIEASGDATSLKKAINFYRNLSDANPDWTITLNPRSNPNDAATARLGFNISDGEGNSRFFIDRATGNVGVGTTSPGAKLEVGGDISAGNSDIYFTKTDHTHSGKGNTAGYAALENAKDYDALMILGRAGTAKGRYVRLWDYLQVNGGLDITGNVGIGTATPNTKLHVIGDVRAEDGTLWLRAGSDMNHGVGWYGANKLFANANVDGPVVFGFAGGALGTTSGGQKLALYWDNNGNIGIGTATPKGFQVALPESSKGSAAPGPGVIIAGGPQGNASIELRNNGSGTPFIDFAQAGTTTDFDARIRLTEPGKLAVEGANVGIGTTNPGVKLHIAGAVKIDAANTLEFGAGISGKEGNAGKIGYQTFTADALDIVGAGITGANRKLQFWAEGGATFTGSLIVSGNIGIGTTTPGAKLEINAISTTEGGWLEAIRFTRPEHSAITLPGGGLLFGLHSDRNFYFADIKGGFKKYVMSINAETGNVKLTNDLSVPGGVENLRMLRGVIASDGAVVGGTGFTVRRAAVGIYDMTFTQAFPVVPGATATQIYGSLNSGNGDPTNAGGDPRDNAVIVHLSANKLRVKTGDNVGNPSDRYFSFIVIGPR